MSAALARRPHRAAPGWGRRGAAGLLTVALGLAGCSSGSGGDAGASLEAATSSGGASVAAAATPPGASLPTRADLAAVTALVRSRAAAVVAGDDGAYAASIADPGSVAGRRQMAALRAARALRVSRLATGAAVVEPAATGALSGEGTGAAAGRTDTLRVRVPVSYRLEGLDRADRTTSVLLDVVRAPTLGAGWAVVAESTDAAGAPAWVAMPGLVVRRGVHAVVAGTAPAARLAEHVRVVDRALPALRRAWSRTPEQVLVLAPATPQEADALLGRAPGSGQGVVGATTEGPAGPDGRATGDRVVLDPTADSRLTPAGRDVVLTHELTHVAVRASVAGRTAGWLSEGYADHVGYTRADVPTARLLAPLVAQVRAGRGPTELPRLADLDPGSGAIEVPYLAAWQAVELVADLHGEAALRRLVAQGSARGSEADAEAATDAALERVLGTTRAELTRAWRQRLRDLAR